MARRPTTEQKKTTIVETDLYTLNDGIIHDLAVPKQVYLAYRFYTGGVTPGFISKHRRALPFNGYHLEKSTHYPGAALFNAVYPQPAFGRTYRRSIKQDSYVLLHSVSRSHLGEADDLAAARLAKQFNSVKTNLLLMFHERKKTVDMIKKNAERIVRAGLALAQLNFRSAYRALHLDFNAAARELSFRQRRRLTRARSDPKRFGSYADAMSATWLELKYGWQPMLQDIYGACEVLSESYRPEVGKRYAVKSSGTLRTDAPVYFTGLGFNAINVGTFTKRTTTKFLAIYSPDTDAITALRETGITNPALTAWDAVPYSFVIDWFLPVTAYLERLQAYSGFEFHEVAKVQFTRYSMVVQGQAHNTGVEYGGRWTEDMSVAYGEDGIMYDRVKLTRPPEVPLSFKDPLSVSHATSAIALLQQVFGKSRR